LYTYTIARKEEIKRRRELPSYSVTYIIRFRVTMNQVATFRAPDVKQEEEDKTINVKVRISFGSTSMGGGCQWGVAERGFSRIQVVSSSGDEVFFKVRYTAKLSKLQDAFASKVGKDVSSIRCPSLQSNGSYSFFFPPFSPRRCI
jgi:hypothetical protein